jgi:hypothetical protein
VITYTIEPGDQGNYTIATALIVIIRFVYFVFFPLIWGALLVYCTVQTLQCGGLAG